MDVGVVYLLNHEFIHNFIPGKAGAVRRCWSPSLRKTMQPVGPRCRKASGLNFLRWLKPVEAQVGFRASVKGILQKAILSRKARSI